MKKAKQVPDQEFDRYSISYDEEIKKSLPFWGKDHDFYTKAKTRRLLNIARSLATGSSKLKVLDVGCGTGITMSFMTDASLSMTGIDISDKMIEQARIEVPSCAFHVFDGKNIPAPDHSYDLVYSINVFHHVPPAIRPALLKDMARVTKPGGIVALLEHNPLNPLTMHVVRSCAFDVDAILLPMKESKSILADAGLVDIDARYMLFIPLWNWLSDKIDHLCGRIPAGTQYVALGRKRGG